jgi:hypothetical protein
MTAAARPRLIGRPGTFRTKLGNSHGGLARGGVVKTYNEHDLPLYHPCRLCRASTDERRYFAAPRGMPKSSRGRLAVLPSGGGFEFDTFDSFTSDSP